MISCLQVFAGVPDYLCLASNGSVRAWASESNLWWNDRGNIKTAEGFNRSNVRFADIDGNGTFSFFVFIAPQLS
jgi:hypothetical protein